MGSVELQKSKIPILASYIAISEIFYGHLGNCGEAILLNLGDRLHSLVNVTGQKIWAPITNIVLNASRQHGDNVANMVGYSCRIEDGLIIKSPIIFIRGDACNIVGFLYTNCDLTKVPVARGIPEESRGFAGLPAANDPGEENFTKEVEDLIDQLLDRFINRITTPIGPMDKNEKMDIVIQLANRSVFLVKGTVEQVTRILGVSCYTIYSYIDKVRSKEGATSPPNSTRAKTTNVRDSLPELGGV